MFLRQTIEEDRTLKTHYERRVCSGFACDRHLVLEVITYTKWATRANRYKWTQYIPRTQLTSIFEGKKPSKTRPFSIKTRVSWDPGIYTYIYIPSKPRSRQKRGLQLRPRQSKPEPGFANGHRKPRFFKFKQNHQNTQAACSILRPAPLLLIFSFKLHSSTSPAKVPGSQTHAVAYVKKTAIKKVSTIEICMQKFE